MELLLSLDVVLCADAEAATTTERRTDRKVDEAYMVLGLAHLRNNNKTEARKAFNLVKRDPTMVRIAKLWNLNT